MRRWLTLALVGLTIAVATPVAWWATRPTAAGVPVAGPASPAGPVPGVTAETPTATGPTPSRTAPSTRNAVVRKRSPRKAPAPTGFRLAVPSLGINAPVTPVGVRADGSMAIPEPVQDVGWYRYGPAPGARAGSAVLAGHVDSAEQGEGALFDLRTVDVGARIDVTLASGRTVRYRVTGRQTFVKKRLPTEQLFARDGAPRLVIITCGGPFNAKLSSYRDNLVVAAEPVG